MDDIKVSIKYAAPMFRIRVVEPDGAISVYGGRSVEEAHRKLLAGRERLSKILVGQGESPQSWESALIAKVNQHVSEFCG